MADSIQWRNHNRYRTYPFIEDQILEGGGLTLENSTIIDFYAVVYGDFGLQVKLNQVDVAAAGATVTFRFQYGPDSDPSYASIIVPGSTEDPYEGQVRIAGPDDGSVILIKAVFAEGVKIITDEPANHSMTFDFDVPVEPALVSVNNSSRVTSVSDLQGDVHFADGYNVRVSLNQNSNTLKFSAARGAGQGTPCEPFHNLEPNDCEGLVFSINGQHPDWFGNFVWQGGSSIVVLADPVNNRIVLQTPIEPDRPKCKDPE
jgi:hypothetical protein